MPHNETTAGATLVNVFDAIDYCVGRRDEWARDCSYSVFYDDLDHGRVAAREMDTWARRVHLLAEVVWQIRQAEKA